MDDLIFELVWEDENIFEIKITAKTQHLIISEKVYLNKEKMLNLSETIIKYVNNPKIELYYESGKKIGNFSSAFSIEFKGLSKDSKAKLELDMEILDDEIRGHWCKFYLFTELSLLEKFAYEITKFPNINFTNLNGY